MGEFAVDESVRLNCSVSRLSQPNDHNDNNDHNGNNDDNDNNDDSDNDIQSMPGDCRQCHTFTGSVLE